MSDWTKDLHTLRYHWKILLFWVVLVALSLVLLLSPAGATTVLEKTFPALVQDAEMIAVGTVTAIKAEWDAEKKAPFTLVTFSDLTVSKGDTGQAELTLHFLGGPTPDGMVMQIAGTPQFRLGERAVVFVTGNETNAVPIVGMWQGVYRVVFDSEREIEIVHTHAGQPVTTLPMVQTQGGIVHDEPLSSQTHQVTQGEAMPLDTFLQLIEQEVRNGQ